MEELLNKLTKNELIDLINELITNNELTSDIIKNYLCIKDMSNEELNILEKIKNSISLNDIEKEYIQNVLDKRNNTKLNSLLHGKDKFIKAIIEIKIKNYFSICWENYPKKVGKLVGYKSFVKLVRDFKLKDLNSKCMYILQKIKQYKQNCENEQKEEQFIMHFTTFCNSKKYL